MKIDADTLAFATVRELELIEALEKHGSYRKAAKAIDVPYSTIADAVVRVRRRAALRGHSPEHDMTRPAPDGYRVKGTSTLYDGDGKLRAQWVKTDIDAERREELIRESIRALTGEIRPLAQLPAVPERCLADLLAVYPLGDPHIGMYAWGQETGADFDLDEARRLTLGAVDRLVQSAPAAEHAILLPLGDVFHMNDQSNTTPKSKHQLDADSRFVKVLRVGVDVFQHAARRLLEKHQHVTVRFVAGNHDPEAVWGLAVAIAAFFANEPRITVDLSPAAHWFFRFGNVLLGATHGDKSRAEQLPGVMSTDRRQDWGEAKHCYWLCGHVHNSGVKEFPGVLVETFRTLAAADAYAAGHGYRAGRDMRCIVYHRDHGEIERHRCDVGMVT